MIINHNLGAMNALSALNANSNALNSALEKLSTGKKINSAADNASGYAISQKMQAQINGLNQASQNAQDGISMIQTASGALNETTSILQNMRQLATQAANSTTTSSDRADLQTQFNQLSSQINNIGNTTQFNTKNLLDGSLGAQNASGTTNATVFSSALGSATSATATTAAQATGTLKTYAAGANATESIQVDGANITFNASSTTYAAFDNGTSVNTAGLATQLNTDINAGIDAYNKTNGTNISHVSVTDSGASNGTISIASGTTGNTSTILLTPGAAATSDLWKALGYTVAQGNQTGLEGSFSVAGAAQATALTAANTMNVTVDGTAVKVTLATTGGKTYSAGGTDMASLATNLQTDINNAITSYNGTVPTASKLNAVTVAVKNGELEVSSGTSGASGNVAFDSSSAAQLLGLSNQSSAGQSGGLTFQIGANAGQTMTLNISDMRASALKITGTAGTTGYSTADNVTNGTDNSNTEAALDITSTSNADSAIKVIDNAVQNVTNEQANLGAVQNRLQSTINNLGTSSQNLTTAQSGITDVDMAAEMSQFTQHNVLQQAAVSMLAQANQQPQLVLKLLG